MRGVRGILTVKLTPFTSPCTMPTVWRYLSPSTAPASCEAFSKRLEGITRSRTYQLQMIAGVGTDVLHDVAVGHSFGNRREPPFLEGVRDPNEVENIGVGQVLPHDNFFAETLHSS